MLKENEELVFDAEKQEEWKAKIEELGLAGQSDLLGDKDSPIPFLWMNKRLKGVFKMLCPRSDEMSKYKKTPIPIEALGLIGLAVKERYFESISIWYDDVKPDPIAVGETSDKEFYAIARWGAEDKSLAALEDEARKKCEEDTRMQLERKMAECKTKLASLPQIVEERLSDGYFYV
jgi:hypothetical protein